MSTPEVRLAALSASLNAGVGTAERLSFADLAALLSPIDGASPAGEWVRYDPAFDSLKDLRREDDSTTPQGIWARDLKRSDLSGVHRLATDLLTRRSKDLQIAAWLLEAWIRTHGFPGARIGFALILGLCDQYWAELHPLPDGDDYDARAATIDWINERLPARIADVAVTKPTDVDGRAYTWAERAEALRRETLAKRLGKAAKPPAKPSDDWLTTAKFTSSTAATPVEFFVDLESDTSATLESVRVLQALLDDRCGSSSAPSLRRISDLLTEVRRFAAGVLEERGHTATSASLPTASELAADVAAPTVSAAGSAAVSSSILDEVMQQTPTVPPAAATPADNVAARTEAYRKLAEAADTLMRIEPHSPTPYLVRRAIAWGGMSLAELMRHFIDSGYDLKSLYTMLGMGE